MKQKLLKKKRDLDKAILTHWLNKYVRKNPLWLGNISSDFKFRYLVFLI